MTGIASRENVKFGDFSWKNVVASAESVEIAEMECFDMPLSDDDLYTMYMFAVDVWNIKHAFIRMSREAQPCESVNQLLANRFTGNKYLTPAYLPLQ